VKDKIILLVEDNPNDEALTLRALEKNNLLIGVMWPTMGLKHWTISSAPARTPITTRA
jgi:hypothetical protein